MQLRWFMDHRHRLYPPMAGVAPDFMEVPTTAIIIIATTITTAVRITATGGDRLPGTTARGAPMAIGEDRLPGAAVLEARPATVVALPPGAAVLALGTDRVGARDPSVAEC